MSLSQIDRKKLMIAAGVVVVALIVLVFVLRGSRRQASQAGPAGAFTGGEQTAAGTGTAAEGSAPAAPGTEEQAAAGEAEAPTGAMLGAVRLGAGSDVVTRPDPLLTFDPPPVPTPPELLVNPPPVALVPGGLRPEIPPEIAAPESVQIGRYRVAGIMFNDGAFAILEAEPGQTFVVRPGDVVENNLITAIARDSIYLVDSAGRRWRVELRGRGPGGVSLSSSAGATGTIAGMPGSPPTGF